MWLFEKTKEQLAKEESDQIDKWVAYYKEKQRIEDDKIFSFFELMAYESDKLKKPTIVHEPAYKLQIMLNGQTKFTRSYIVG